MSQSGAVEMYVEVVPADALSAGRADHASADRVAVVFHPEGRCVDGTFVAPSTQRVQHRYQFPARGMRENLRLPHPASGG